MPTKRYTENVDLVVTATVAGKVRCSNDCQFIQIIPTVRGYLKNPSLYTARCTLYDVPLKCGTSKQDPYKRCRDCKIGELEEGYAR